MMEIQTALPNSPHHTRHIRIRKLKSFVERGILLAMKVGGVAKGINANRHSLTIPECTYSPWIFDREFLDIYEVATKNTLLNVAKCWTLYHTVKQLSNLNGAVAEIGVWRGGSGIILAEGIRRSNSKSSLHLFDTFEGVPNNAILEKDNQFRGGEVSDTSVDHVKGLFMNDNFNFVQVHKGIFPVEVGMPDPNPTLKLVHIDVDTYKSAKDVTEYCWSILEPGGMLLFEDYGYFSTEGVTEYVNEFVSKNQDCTFIYNTVGYGMIIKR